MPAIDKVCAGQHFILGEQVRALEQEIAGYCSAAVGVGVSSGTDALLLALMALSVGAGDEVITSPFTFFATAGTIARAGARPVFCDIDPHTFNIAPAAVQTFIDDRCAVKSGQLIHRATGGRIKALMPVHLYGQCADMDPLMIIARRYDLRVIEDARRPSVQPTRTANMPARSATLAAFPSFRVRISARSAMPGCAPPTTRNWPSACGYCGCTAASRSIFTR